MSVDGRITPAPDMTMFDPNPVASLLPDELPLWEKTSKAIEDEWHPGGALFGSGTFNREGDPVKDLPAFAGDAQALYEDYLPQNVLSGTRYWGILVDGRGRGRSGYKGTETPGQHVLHVVSETVPAEYLAFLRSQQIPYLIGGQSHADLPGALFKLRNTLGLRAICLMGGGTLNGAMVRQNLVDEIHLVVLPVFFGGRRTPTLVDCDELAFGTTLPVLELLSAEAQQNGLLWLHYKVHTKSLAKP